VGGAGRGGGARARHNRLADKTAVECNSCMKNMRGGANRDTITNIQTQFLSQFTIAGNGSIPSMTLLSSIYFRAVLNVVLSDVPIFIEHVPFKWQCIQWRFFE
jgi:hypothetical protein